MSHDAEDGADGTVENVIRATSMDVAPDGELVVYATCHADGLTATEVLDDTRRYPVGKFQIPRGLHGFYEIKVWNRIGQTVKGLAAGLAPAWSPDGQCLAFLSTYDYACTGNDEFYDRSVAAPDLYRMHGDGSGVQQLVASADAPPQVSPDGRRLAMVRRTRALGS